MIHLETDSGTSIEFYASLYQIILPWSASSSGSGSRTQPCLSDSVFCAACWPPPGTTSFDWCYFWEIWLTCPESLNKGCSIAGWRRHLGLIVYYYFNCYHSWPCMRFDCVPNPGQNPANCYNCGTWRRTMMHSAEIGCFLRSVSSRIHAMSPFIRRPKHRSHSIDWWWPSDSFATSSGYGSFPCIVE